MADNSLSLHRRISSSKLNTTYSSLIILSFTCLAGDALLFLAGQTDLFLLRESKGREMVMLLEFTMVIFCVELFLGRCARGQRLRIGKNRQKYIMPAQKTVLVYVGNAVTLLSGSHDVISPLETEYQAVRKVDSDSQQGSIYQMPTQLFKNALNEGLLGNCEGALDVGIVWMHDVHQDWLKVFSHQNAKMYLVDDSQKGQRLRVQQSVCSLFSFKYKLSISNLQEPADHTIMNTLDVLPERYLLVDLTKRIDIYRVEKDSKVMLYRSNLDESFHIAIIHQALSQHHPQALLSSINQIITKAFIQGNSQNCDLLVQDIFGKQGCTFIGLPPKLIAASLGKISSNKGKNSEWDSLKSVLVAFGINLGKQINHQVHSTKIKTTILVTNEFTAPQFLQIIDFIASLQGELWIHPHGMLQSFKQALHSLQNKSQRAHSSQ